MLALCRQQAPLALRIAVTANCELLRVSDDTLGKYQFANTGKNPRKNAILIKRAGPPLGSACSTLLAAALILFVAGSLPAAPSRSMLRLLMKLPIWVSRARLYHQPMIFGHQFDCGFVYSKGIGNRL